MILAKPFHRSLLLDLPEVFTVEEFERRLLRAGKSREEVSARLADALHGIASEAVAIGTTRRRFLNLALRHAQMKDRHGMLQSRAFDQQALKTIFPEAMIGGHSALYHFGWSSRVAPRMNLVIPAQCEAGLTRIRTTLDTITSLFDGFHFSARREPNLDRANLVSRTEGILPMMYAEYALADLMRNEHFDIEAEDLDFEEILELMSPSRLELAFRQLDVDIPPALRVRGLGRSHKKVA